MKFLPPSAFAGETGYRLLPFRFRRLPWDAERVFVTSVAGDWLLMKRDDLDRVVLGQLGSTEALFLDLEARHLIATDVARTTLAPLLSQYRTRKSYLNDGPALHIFVVSLRCHHTCAYCQVSRQPTTAEHFDLSDRNARFAVERLFEWPSKELTVEFQGGEPLLHFDRVRSITEMIRERNIEEKRRLRFVLASTLHDVTDEQLAFFKEHDFLLSTSLDGPEWLHNANRPRPERDSYRRTIMGIERGRRVLGDESVSALTTLTRRSLEFPKEIVDEYRKLGFHSIALRPLSPYGFARKTQDRNGYPIADFLRFYVTALDHLIEINRSGYSLDESFATLLLSQLFTPFSHGYVDLRSPTGAAFGAIVYDYDGRVYPSDEARMLAAMGDSTFALGHVEETVSTWLASTALQRIAQAGIAEALPTCADCAYVAFCGADPIDHYARQGEMVGHRPSSDFCRKQMGLFDLLLQRWEQGSPAERAILEGWALRHVAETAPIKEAA
jgi:His-Xaa-Ser system radical SAM maturase HxsB